MRKSLFISAVAVVLVSLFAAASSARSVTKVNDDKLDPNLKATLATLAPGEMTTVIVTLRDRADLAAISGASRPARLKAAILALRNKATLSQVGIHALLRARAAQGKVARTSSFWIVNGLSVTATVGVIQELTLFPGVESIAPDEVPVVPTAGLPEPNISAVDGPTVWGLGYTGQGVVVASLDSGVDLSHPDLANRWRGGTNSWFDPYGQHPASPVDLTGHGTGTMGVMVGGDAGGTSIGMAPGAQWIAARIFDDSGKSTATAIHSAFQWLLDPDGNPNTADAPDVVNNSWSYGYRRNLQPDVPTRRAGAAGGRHPPGLRRRELRAGQLDQRQPSQLSGGSGRRRGEQLGFDLLGEQPRAVRLRRDVNLVSGDRGTRSRHQDGGALRYIPGAEWNLAVRSARRGGACASPQRLSEPLCLPAGKRSRARGSRPRRLRARQHLRLRSPRRRGSVQYCQPPRTSAWWPRPHRQRRQPVATPPIR